jgi:8-oxo-dGTP diphosphatase
MPVDDNGSFFKQTHVSCAIIRQGDFTLAVQRNVGMSLPLKWEFPGGKIEKNETPEECLRRELKEELELCIQIGEALKPITHAYATFTVILHPFICVIKSGKIVLREHAAFAWLTTSELPALDWADADRPVLNAYLKMPVRGTHGEGI